LGRGNFVRGQPGGGCKTLSVETDLLLGVQEIRRKKADLPKDNASEKKKKKQSTTVKARKKEQDGGNYFRLKGVKKGRKNPISKKKKTNPAE